jgi:cysteine-rich repeat protein
LLLCALACAAFGAACGGGGAQHFATCGNGHLDVGERCDDGNTDEHDACTSACQPARCGDGVAQTGVEACDGRDLLGATCADVGQFGLPACSRQCGLDYSVCVEQPPTPTAPPPPPSPTPTATAAPAACGDGLLSADETCSGCPADCTAQPCAASGDLAVVSVSLQLPVQASQISFALFYRTSTVSLPQPPSGRVSSLTTASIPLRANVVDGYRVTVVSPGGQKIDSGPFAAVRFDRCAAAPAPTAQDFVCRVTVCKAGDGSALSGCACAASPPDL